jgi:hypothetical protein
MGSLGRGAFAVVGSACALLVACAALAPAAFATTGQSPTVTLRASRPRLRNGNTETLFGTVTNAPSASQVELYQDPFPYTTATLIGTVTPSATGTFSFPVSPQRNTRYVAILTGTAARAVSTIGVFYPLKTKVRALRLGRAAIRIVVYHPPGLRWGGALAKWFFKSTTHRNFYEARSTKTRWLSPTAIEIRMVRGLPAGQFRWRVCFHAPQDQAILNSHRPPGCRGRGYEGSGRLPAGYPRPAAVARAASYEAHRIGSTAFAVRDSEGRISGRNIHRRFLTASVVKAMLLVAYLRLKQARGQHTITSNDRSILAPMIEVSDNNAASRCQDIVGNPRLYALARAAHMTDFSIVGSFFNAMTSAADQARYFFEMNSLIPHEFVGYANYLLSHIVSYESWGIPAVARPRGYRVYFKGGWFLPFLVNQAARLHGHGKRFAIAVLTYNDPSFTYGIDTIQGVAATLLR